MKIFNSLSFWGKLLFLVLLILLSFAFYKIIYPKKMEGFQESEKTVDTKTDSNIYDDFYVGLYDNLVFNNIKNTFELGEILNATKPNADSVILDIGSGTGHHVGELGKQGYDATGIDLSFDMVQKAKENYPTANFVQGNAMNRDAFPQNKFTHILCLYFSIYYFKDKVAFAQNCIKWLMPGGFLVIHVVDRNNFDPILPPANPLLLVSPQRYAEKRITQSRVVFDGMTYIANFRLSKEKNKATFKEKIKNNDTGSVRINEHTLYMEPEKDLVTEIKKAGFIVQGKIDLIKVGYEYQYLYIFIKPG
jgi:SAM-dependent methyltransferase